MCSASNMASTTQRRAPMTARVMRSGKDGSSADMEARASIEKRRGDRHAGLSCVSENRHFPVGAPDAGLLRAGPKWPQDSYKLNKYNKLSCWHAACKYSALVRHNQGEAT